MIQIIVASLVVMLASLVGTISVWKSFGKVIEKNLHYLVSFSAGVFILIAYELAHESNEIIWIITGAIVSLITFKLLPNFHHHHDNKQEEHGHSNIDARRVVFSDAIHNFGDGILIAAAFSVNTTLGFATAVSVFIHEVIQEISEFFVLRQAGLSTKKTLLINFIASSTILIGAISGYFLLEKFESIEHALLGITAGAFFVVVLHDLIPHSVKSIKTKSHILKHVLWFLIGLILISLAGSLIPHLH